VFFYKFFEATEKKVNVDAVNAVRTDEIEEEVDEEMDEDEVWKAMQRSSGFAATGLNEDEDDELSGEDQVWPSDDEDASEEGAGSDDGDLDIAGSDEDGEMEAWGKEEEEDDNAPAKPIRGKRSIMKMSEKAKMLGFTGDYFDKLLISKTQDDDDSGEFEGDVFAQADDFEGLLDLEQEQGDEDSGEKGGKRPRGFASRRKIGKKQRKE
jgi:hypothetical protein